MKKAPSKARYAEEEADLYEETVGLWWCEVWAGARTSVLQMF